MIGWIKIHRQITEWEWYQDSKTVHLFLHLLLKANSKDRKWRGVDVKRGQVVTGLNALELATGISSRSLRTCLKRLEESGEISRKATSKFSLITLCNYRDYQRREDAQRQTNDKQTTSERQAIDKRPTIKRQSNDNKQEGKEREEGKEEKKKKKKSVDCLRPEWIPENLWKELIANRKFKKIQNTELALKTFTNSLKKGMDAGFTIEKCIGEYVSSSWKRFDHSWIKKKGQGNNGTSNSNSQGNTGYIEPSPGAGSEQSDGWFTQ